MDDGDILGLQKSGDVQDPHVPVQRENLKDPRKEFLVQHCGGELNLRDVKSWSESNKHRYYLSTRTVIPLEKKLEEFIGDLQDHDTKSVDESLLVLSTLAKIFIAEKIENVRRRKGMDFSCAITKSDLLESREVMSAI